MPWDACWLARTQYSTLDVPPLDNSAMDGYAVRCADVALAGTRLPLSQRIPAGSVPQPLQSGTAARIFTGAPIPATADAVVIQEKCAVADGGIIINCAVSPGMNIRRRGDDIANGAEILPVGTRACAHRIWGWRLRSAWPACRCFGGCVWRYFSPATKSSCPATRSSPDKSTTLTAMP